jgi:hypothetical protein
VRKKKDINFEMDALLNLKDEAIAREDSQFSPRVPKGLRLFRHLRGRAHLCTCFHLPTIACPDQYACALHLHRDYDKRG